MVKNKQNTLRCVAALGLSGLAVVAQLYTQLPASAQAPAPAGAGGLVAILPVPLDTVPVPMPADLDIYIKDRAAAIKLGKASFYAQANQPLDAAYRCASADLVRNLLAEDGIEGVDAFFEKRTPQFRQ